MMALRRNGNYHEPFLGGGAVFFDLRPTGAAYLSDLNQELIETYVAVRDDVTGVVSEMRSFENTSECYYATRAASPAKSTSRAARFIFLNQTSFNGIYRVNLKGEYNVPYGNRSKHFLDESNLRAVSEQLAQVDLCHDDFEIVRRRAQPGDFVFLDPPYTVSHNDNGFVKYNERLFSMEDQLRLGTLVRFLDDSGIGYVLTNAAHPAVAEIFEGNRRLEVSRVSRVGGRHAPRGVFNEYVFTNLGAP